MGEAWTESQEGISVFFFAFSALLAVVLVLSVSEGLLFLICFLLCHALFTVTLIFIIV